MIYTEKIKIHPDKELESRLYELSNNTRFIFNYIMSESIKLGIKKPNKIHIRKLRDLYRSLIKENNLTNKDGDIIDSSFLVSLKNTPSQIPDLVVDDVYRAWSTLKKKDKPNFRKKSDAKNSFTLHKKNGSTFKYSNNILTVSKMQFKLNPKKLRFKLDAEDIKLINISKNTYGWYINITREIPDSALTLPKTNKSVGIDWGVKYFASDSDGDQVKFKDLVDIKNYEFLYNKLKFMQSKLSKKRINSKDYRKSKRYNKLKEKIRHLHEKLTNIRKDFLHHVSKYYVTNYDNIVIEDLKPRNMLKNHKLARVISQSMFYTWKLLLTYKCNFYGKTLHLVDPKYTSQTCSCCGNQLQSKLSLSNRLFKCEDCDNIIDRDLNAAINILNKANL